MKIPTENRSYGPSLTYIGEANEKDARMNGAEIRLFGNQGPKFEGAAGTVYLTFVNRQEGIVQAWANIHEHGCALCLGPDDFEITSGHEHEKKLAELLAELPHRSKAMDKAAEAQRMKELNDRITMDVITSDYRALALRVGLLTEAIDILGQKIATLDSRPTWYDRLWRKIQQGIK